DEALGRLAVAQQPDHAPLAHAGLGRPAEGAGARRAGWSPAARRPAARLTPAALALPLALPRRLLPRHAEAQRRVRDAQRVLLVGVNEGHVRGHARPQLELRVVHVDDRVVGDHALHRLRRVADLAHRALERLARKGVDGEGDAHAGVELADVGLG